MGNNRENEDTSSFQSISYTIIGQSAGTQNKHKASDIEPKSHHFPADPLGGTITFAPSATLGCTFPAAEKENLILRNPFSGYIFMCNGKTKADCYRYRVFGLPAARMNVVEKIRPSMTLFLFDFDLKLLYGVYTAACSGGLGIEPNAFGGKFLAQVKFEISKDCLPLPERLFKHAITYNYCGGSKFKQELSKEQVANLISLFTPISIPPAIFARTEPAAERSALYDQYLTDLKGSHFELPGSLSHNQQAQHVPPASVAKLPCELMDVQSFNLQPIVSRRQCSSYIPQQNHQPYVPENIALLQNNAHNRVFGLAPHSHVAMSETAAYWDAVASEDREVVGSCEERVPSANSFLGDMYSPVLTSSSIFYPSVQENSRRRTSHLVVAASNDLHASKPLHYQIPSDGGMHLPLSSTVRFSDNSKLVCFEPHPGLPLESARVEAGALPLPYLTRNVHHISVPQSSENGVNMLTTCTHASHYDAFASAAKALSVPPQTSTSYGYTHSLSAPGAVAYWNDNGYGYHHSQGALITDETSQAHCQAPLQVLAPFTAAAYSHYSDGGASGIAAVSTERQN